MAEKTYKPLLIDSVKAVSNLKQHRFVGLDGNVCQAGAKAYGVCDVETDAEQYTPVAVLGILLIETGGAITIGAEVTSDAEGKAVAVTGSEKVNGYALDESTTSGEIIRIVRGI